MKELLLTVSLLCAGDSATTHAGLALGGRELNPVGNPWLLDSVRGGAMAGLWIAAPRTKGRTRVIARVALITLGAVEGYAVAHNVVELRKQQRYLR